MNIIKRMNQLREICRIIKIVEEESKRIEDNPEHVKRMKKVHIDKATIFDGFLPRTHDVIDLYRKRYDCTRYQARNAFKDAADEKYISTFDEDYKIDHEWQFRKYVEVNPSGRTLNSTVFKIPTGRYNTWLNNNGSLVNFLLGGGAGIVISILGLAAKAIWGS